MEAGVNRQPPISDDQPTRATSHSSFPELSRVRGRPDARAGAGWAHGGRSGVGLMVPRNWHSARHGAALHGRIPVKPLSSNTNNRAGWLPPRLIQEFNPNFISYFRFNRG